MGNPTIKAGLLGGLITVVLSFVGLVPALGCVTAVLQIVTFVIIGYLAARWLSGEVTGGQRRGSGSHRRDHRRDHRLDRQRGVVRVPDHGHGWSRRDCGATAARVAPGVPRRRNRSEQHHQYRQRSRHHSDLLWGRYLRRRRSGCAGWLHRRHDDGRQATAPAGWLVATTGCLLTQPCRERMGPAAATGRLFAGPSR